MPSLWRLEVANVLRQAVPKGRMDTATQDASLADLLELPIRIDDEAHARAWADTLSLANQTGLTVHDAAYLKRAMRLQLTLATTDKALRHAATAENLTVLCA